MHTKRLIFILPLTAILTAILLFGGTAFSAASASSGQAEAAPQLQTTTNARGCDDTITVTTGTDSGAGSLRQAVAGVCDGGTITFGNAMTVTLSSKIDIDKRVTIDGENQPVIISGADTSELLEIGSSAALTLTQVTIADGVRPVQNSGSLVVNNVTFISNFDKTIDNSGVAIFNNSTFFDNNAGPAGRGTLTNAGTLTVTNTLFKDNNAGRGAGIFNEGTGTTFVSNSTFSGGFSSFGTKRGGGIHNLGALTVTHSTFANNTAPGSINVDGGGSLVLINSVFANNVQSCRVSDSSTIALNVGNWGDTNRCNPDFTGDPKLAPLGDYGGPTETYALQLDSGLHQAVSANCAATDARGVARGSSCDIGAFESQGATLSIVSGDGQLALVNSPFAEPLAVQVTAIDSAEPLVQAGAVVAFTAPSSGASLSTATFTETLDASGTAIASVASNAITGTYTVTASAAAESVGFTLTNFESQGVTLSILSGDGQSADLETPYADPLAIQLTANDPAELLVLEGAIVTFTAPSSGPSLSTPSFTATVDASGTATASVSSNEIIGTYSVVATVFDESVTFMLTNSGCFPEAVVENDNNDGAGSLRRSVLTLCDGGAITFADDMTVTLDFPIFLRERVTIDGEDHDVMISGEEATRIFDVQPNSALTLTHLTIANGHNFRSDREGGAILNKGSLIVDHCQFINNLIPPFDNEARQDAAERGETGGIGGAIYSTDHDLLRISNSHFIDNAALVAGGAIAIELFSSSTPVTEISNTVFQNNQAGSGGAAFFSRATVALDDVVLENNRATSGAGGGIHASQGMLTISNGVLMGNSAENEGGGLSVSGSAEITSTTVISNSASSGGGIFNQFGDFLVTGLTISGNSASNDGGGVLSSGTWRMTDSDVLSNTAGNNGAGLALGGGTNTIERVSIKNNVATGDGGGIYFDRFIVCGPVRGEQDDSARGCRAADDAARTQARLGVGAILLINTSTIADNQAVDGGGIYNVDVLQLLASTLSGNLASGTGGGLHSRNSAELQNCTISGNQSAASDGVGGIYNSAGFFVNESNHVNDSTAESNAGISSSLTLSHCTVTGNSGGLVGGILHEDFTELVLRANIIAGNAGSGATAVAGPSPQPPRGGGSGPSAENVFGQSGQSNAETFSNFVPGDSDFIATDDGTPTALSSILNPMLANNGGPSTGSGGGSTLTHALVSTSPALERELSCSVFDDQRGVQRPVGTSCDAGSFESDLVPTAVVLAGDVAAFGVVNNVLLLLLPVLLIPTKAAIRKRSLR